MDLSKNLKELFTHAEEIFSPVSRVLYESLKANPSENNFKNISSYISNNNFTKNTIKRVLECAENNKDIRDDAKTLEEIEYLLRLTSFIYNKTGLTTGMSDSEYDVLYEYYQEMSGKDLVITNPESDDSVNHQYPTLRGTLDKIYKITDEDVLKNPSQKSLDVWVKQMERRYFEKTGETINLMDCDVIVMPKFDGVSCVFENDSNGKLLRALTRGDTDRNEAEDISHVFKDIYEPPFTDADKPYGLKTEIMMTNSDFEELNKIMEKPYKNTRSAVSSIINSDETNGNEKYLTIVQLRYAYLDDDEPSHQYLPPQVYQYPYLKCKLNEIEKIHEFAFNNKTVHPGLRCDGAVIRILDENVQKVLGRENEKQKFEVAFKYTEETAYSEVTDIEFTTGLFGRITPVAVFKPVKMKGNTIDHASLGSYGRFKNLELCKGDVIKILYDIIPYADFDSDDSNCVRSGKKVIQIPEICPDCGEALTENDTGEIISCSNPKCPCRERGRILNYCKNMGIANISYATISDLYDKRLLCAIEDLYFLKNHIDEISEIPGYGSKKIANILDEIDNHREVIPSVLLGSLGIESVSTKKFKKILEYLTMGEIIEYSHDEISSVFECVPGIKEKTAKKIIDGINNSIHTINILVNELTVLNEPRNTGDYSVVFTKVRDEDIEKWIEENGGTVSDNLTKETSILVIPTRGITSNKIDKATKYDIPIVPIDELKDYITKKYL